MNLPRTFRPWPVSAASLVISGFLFCLTGKVGAFVRRPLGCPISITRPFSSTALTESRVALNPYTEDYTYKKTIRKTQKDQERLGGIQEAPTYQEATIPHNKLLTELNRYPALILNADYQPMSYLPLSVCHWQEAIKLIFSGKVAVVDVYEGVMIRAATLEIPLPSVIALNEYVPQASHKPAFTRRNVFLRDEYTCQYCNKPFFTKDLSIDHVLPRSMGGILNWENAVTSCLKCNGRKANMLVSDLKHVGMKLQNKPRAPTRHELAIKAGKMLPRKVHSSWQPYLVDVMGGADDAEHRRPAPDLEALGLTVNGAQEVQKLPKSMTKNKKKRLMKAQQSSSSESQQQQQSGRERLR